VETVVYEKESGNFFLLVAGSRNLLPLAELVLEACNDEFDADDDLLAAVAVAVMKDLRRFLATPGPLEDVLARLDLKLMGHKFTVEKMLGSGFAPAEIADRLRRLGTE
jgi:hypothetical protein